MKLFSSILVLLTLSFSSFGQSEQELTSLLPKYAPDDALHRNKIDNSGKKQGKWQYFSRSGVLVLELTFVNNQKNGEYKRYNGVTGKMIEKGNYLNGIKNGSYTKWFSNGVKRVEGTYANGKKNAMWSYFFKNGTGALRMIGNFHKGKKEGNWIFYDKNGSIRHKVKFELGRPVKQKKDSTHVASPSH
jgi:antitoxin component YwqK of YwqJK toxin-antitoxin module